MAETIYWTEATEAGPTLYGTDVETDLSAGQWGLRIGLHAMVYGTRGELMAFLHRAGAEIQATYQTEHEYGFHAVAVETLCDACADEADQQAGPSR